MNLERDMRTSAYDGVCLANGTDEARRKDLRAFCGSNTNSFR